MIFCARFITRAGRPNRFVLENGKIFVPDDTQKFSPNKGIPWNFAKSFLAKGFLRKICGIIQKMFKKDYWLEKNPHLMNY